MFKFLEKHLLAVSLLPGNIILIGAGILIEQGQSVLGLFLCGLGGTLNYFLAKTFSIGSNDE